MQIQSNEQPLMIASHQVPTVALGRFFSDIKGGAATLVALALPVLMLGLGGGIDLAVASTARAKLQSAVDAAALAAASSGSTDFNELSALADQYFEANTPRQSNISDLSGALSESGSGLRYDASGRVETAFLKLIGKTTIDVEASAQANRETSGVEIVMVLDTTGSMGFGSSWPDAKAAMHDMLQSLDDLSAGNDFYATLVPMADRINVGTDKAAWMSVSPVPTDWEGCFEPREQHHPGFPHALDDDPPDGEPFLPTAEGYHISGLADQSFFTCPAEILGPTDNIASIESAVDSLSLSGTGRFDQGMAWAWRLLSPRWQGRWSVTDYPSNYGERRKVVVLITDKYTVAYDYEVGGADGQSFGWNQGSRRGFEHLVHVCDQMKSEGIEVHAVYVNGNTHGVSYMQQCATDAVHYHEVTNIATLQVTLGKIASDLVRVWLTH